MSDRPKATLPMLPALLIVPLVLLPLVLPASEPAAKRWPAWRGPHAAGTAGTGSYAVRWDAAKHLMWKVKLPGKGCSTPVVWDEHIILTSPAEGEDAVLDFDWDGELRWKTSVGKGRRGKHRNGSGSNPSPVTDGAHVFVYYRSGKLAGLDLRGKLLWKTNLQERFGEDSLYWDIGTSPVITEKHVVVAVMHESGSYLVAFHKKSGDMAWKAARDYDCPTEGDHAYTTPIVIEHRGRQALLVWGAEHLTAHDAADGKVLWSCGGFNPQRRRNWLAVASAVVAGDVVVVPYGRGKRLAGVRLGGEGDVTATHRLWTRDDAGAFVPTPAARDGKVYVLGDRGELTCIDARKGETVWRDRLPEHGTSYYASPVIAGGHLYATREDGVVLVARLTGGFEVLSENDMGERMIASPVPVAGRILLRGERHLFCVAAP
ncbi:MAG: PQQ-binding-like beta-propeller repeat protein [Planctomycetota bacterium]|nr:PQQ-binding-like beta-propeller repeat protein [Planctomycetota bacterium]